MARSIWSGMISFGQTALPHQTPFNPWTSSWEQRRAAWPASTARHLTARVSAINVGTRNTRRERPHADWVATPNALTHPLRTTHSSYASRRHDLCNGGVAQAGCGRSALTTDSIRRHGCLSSDPIRGPRMRSLRRRSMGCASELVSQASVPAQRLQRCGGHARRSPSRPRSRLECAPGRSPSSRTADDDGHLPGVLCGASKNRTCDLILIRDRKAPGRRPATASTREYVSACVNCRKPLLHT
jgi:hypothetical protein